MSFRLLKRKDFDKCPIINSTIQELRSDNPENVIREGI